METIVEGATPVFKRQFLVLADGLMIILASPVGAADLSRFTNKEAISALKTTLLKGADSAIATLGQTNGFLGNPEVKIPLPAFLSDNKRVFKMFDMVTEPHFLCIACVRASTLASLLGTDSTLLA